MLRLMGPRPESPLAANQPHRFPSSPTSSSSTATPSKYTLDSPQGRDKSAASRPAARRAASTKSHPAPRWPNAFHDTDSDGSITETKHGRISPQLHRKTTTRRKSDRALTLPSARTSSGDLAHSRSSPAAGPPLSRRSSSASSSSSGKSPKWSAHPPTSAGSAGIGRKVAASLDLFKESATTPTTEQQDPFDIPKPAPLGARLRTNSSHQLNDIEAPEFEFVKRSEWADREAAASRREKSTTGLERVRTRESVSSNFATHREVEGRKRKERQASIRESVRNDLAQWRNSIALEQDSGRGRPRERPLWAGEEAVELCVGSPESSGSASSASTLQETMERRVTSHSHRQSSTSVHRPPTPRPAELSPILPASVFVPASEHEVPPPAILRTERLQSPSTPPSHPPPGDPPFSLSAYLAQPSALSPWSSDDDDDDESAWESASVTTTTSTTSASFPFPLSPSRTSLAPQPLVRHPSDEDEEHPHRGPLSPFRQAELEHQDRALQPDTQSHDVATDWALNVSQESLPHIPLRPFKNQVGGHSAIYKFTKRAVCKVSLWEPRRL